MNLKSISTVVRFELSRLVRTPAGILFLVFFGIIYGWTFKILHGQGDNIRKAQQAIRSDLGEAPKDVLDNWLFDWLEGLITLAADHSLGLVLVFMLVIFFTPFLSLMAFFEQTAGEVASKHARFILQRLGRTELYLGKAISALIGYAIIMALMVGVGFAVCLSTDVATTGEIGYVVRIWLTSVVYALPFLGLAAFAAALSGHPAFGIMISYGYLFLILVVSKVGAIAGPAFKNVSFASPTHYGYSLMDDNMADIGVALAHQMGLGAVFFIAGLWIFKRRDV